MKGQAAKGQKHERSNFHILLVDFLPTTAEVLVGAMVLIFIFIVL